MLSVIGTATLAPTGFRGGNTPVSPLCLTCARTWLADAISNVALFVPLGAILGLMGAARSASASASASNTSTRAPFVRALLLASLLSLLIEALQYAGFPPGRTASLMDFCTNSGGAALGLLLVAHRHTLLRPAPAVARRLGAAWSVLLVTGLGLSAWAVAPDTARDAMQQDAMQAATQRPTRAHAGMNNTAAAITLSALPHTPDYGWFSGVSESVTVNGVPIPHRGTGPVIVQMPRTDTLQLSAHVRGRDEGVATVPIVWIHAPGTSSPQLMLAQRDRDLIVQTRLHATVVGLATPQLRVHDVMPSPPRDSTTRTTVEVRTRGGMLSVQATNASATATDAATADATTTATLALSPALGWSLIQSVIGNTSRIAPLLSTLWLVLWFLPGGWWLSRRSAPWVLAWASTMLGAVACGALAVGSSLLSGWQVAACLLGAMSGYSWGRLATRRPNPSAPLRPL